MTTWNGPGRRGWHSGHFVSPYAESEISLVTETFNIGEGGENETESLDIPRSAGKVLRGGLGRRPGVGFLEAFASEIHLEVASQSFVMK